MTLLAAENRHVISAFHRTAQSDHLAPAPFTTTAKRSGPPSVCLTHVCTISGTALQSLPSGLGMISRPSREIWATAPLALRWMCMGRHRGDGADLRRPDGTVHKSISDL